MEVNEALVDKLAHLARLQFSPEEKTAIIHDLQRMIGFVEKLNELDLDNVQPLLHLSEDVNVLRDDKISGSISPGLALKNAPVHDELYFKVPKVISR